MEKDQQSAGPAPGWWRGDVTVGLEANRDTKCNTYTQRLTFPKSIVI